MSTVKDLAKEETVISLKPIVRVSWLPKGHDGEYKFTGCETYLVPTRNTQNGQLETGLTEDDERRLEKSLRLAVGTLSKFNTDYWSNYRIRIPKTGKTFYISNPKDELDVLVLKAIPQVANSQQEVMDSPSAIFYLTSQEKEAEAGNAKEKVERRAIKKYGQLSTQEMIDIIKVYALTKGGRANLKITSNTQVDLIETTLYNKLKEDPEEFLRIAEDPNLKTLVLIDNLISKRILIKSGSRYTVMGGETIGVTLEATVEYLEDPHNNDQLIALRAKLEATE